MDGSNYVEKRKIVPGYETHGSGFKESNLLTADQVVQQVTTELRPTIIKIIKITVANYKGDVNKYGDLVETILLQLRPVVSAGKQISIKMI